MHEVTHEALHGQITDLDKRVIRLEEAVSHLRDDGRETGRKVVVLSDSFQELRSAVLERMARMEGGVAALKWGLPIGLTLVTVILGWLIRAQ